jgi:hypothetical protein
MDMFLGDRSGTIVDPDGNSWMIGTHLAEPTAQEMQKAMKKMMMMMSQSAGAAEAS